MLMGVIMNISNEDKYAYIFKKYGIGNSRNKELCKLFRNYETVINMDIEKIIRPARNEFYRLGEIPHIVIEILHEPSPKAHHCLGAQTVPMNRQRTPRLDGIEHPLGPILRRISQIIIHPQPRRGLGREGKII